ncbi:MAG TPA: hypothetical protein VIT63_01450 [Nitrospira sp.]
MLKKSAAGVLASLSGSTYHRAGAARAARGGLGENRLRLAASLAAALLVERRVLARLGWAGENHSLFEHPEVIPQPARGLWRQQ